MAVRRRSAKRRSAIAAKPSAAILARFGTDCLGVEGAEPPASPAVIPGVGWLDHVSAASSQPWDAAETPLGHRPEQASTKASSQATNPQASHLVDPASLRAIGNYH